MEFEIPSQKSDVCITSLSVRLQAVEDIMMRLHSFLDDFVQNILFG